MAAGLVAMQLYIVFILLSSLCQRLQGIEFEDLPDKDVHTGLLLQLLKRIRLERDYDTIVIYGPEPCVFHALLPQLELPTVLLTQGSSWEDWSFSSESLLLICSSDAEQERNTRTLLKLQPARRLVYLELEKQPTEVCQAYFEREQVNVAMVDSVGNLYSCRCFEQENYVQLAVNLSSSYPIYVEQFRNMRGSLIRSEPDQIGPRAMLYRDPSTGKYQMMGIAANLINTFVERVNATLKLRDDIGQGKKIYYKNIFQRVQLNLLDIAATLSSTLDMENYDYLSYPYIHSSFCFMIPMPSALEFKEIYAIIVQPLVAGVLIVLFLIFSLLYIYSEDLNWRRFSLINMLLNDRCLRGLLGHAFPMPAQPSRYLKGICMLICFASIMTTTMYESYLQAYFLRPPHEPMLRSFEDIFASRYKIALERGEASHILFKNFSLTTSNAHHAFILDDWTELLRLRDSFNASFIYPVTEIRWLSFKEQQKHFSKPVFYYSEDICMKRFLLLSLPVRRHLPYRQLFEQHILAMEEFGISKYWVTSTFHEMVRLKLTSFKDYSHPDSYEEEIFLRDLTQIFIFYLAAHLLACICFAIECGWSKIFGIK
ncbi:uncharacterized protein LOC111597663 [Drosophila hydei]|uniref:Uncharacterized protein LOC111597663 n=1 Tax=Drosophila hydei TaxID=7224 RepID=A0A6J1LSZ4_DROHY|nr:uncharacterized protein LOC111597663 [Drosophila hydei]